MIAVAAPDDLLARPVVLVVALAAVSLLPFAFMTVTAFVKISTVLHIVRSAIGAQNVPSGTVIMALSGALTVLAMVPVGQNIVTRLAPVVAAAGREAGDTVAVLKSGFEAVREPVRDFLRANTSDIERARFFDVAVRARSDSDRENVHADDLSVLVPAFIVTELGQAFAVGFLVYLPFLVVDLVIANVLLALGMQMMNPTQVSLPFKLLLFVAIDGWGLLGQSLVAGYR